jgi:membrane peptidoglycan carboxypeptidase
MGERLLSPEALGNVVYSFILMERTESGNVVRVQADSADRPFDVNDQAKLDLGSTAKLRTLITYLDIIADLHERFARLDAESLRWVRVSPHDPLSQWALDYLAHAKDRSLHAMLEEAMERQYSANPGEAFFTGGGVHHFENFHHEDDHKTVTLRLAFHESINLPFIRLMRDVVQHEMFGNGAAGWLEAVEEKERQSYLTRFADREGETFLRRFYQKYRKLDPDGMLDALAKEAGLSPTRLTVALLTVAPDAGPEALREYLQAHLPEGTPFDADALHAKYAPERFTLSDRGALARIHPLELWLVEYLRREPGARFADVLEASSKVRQEVYGWLFAKHDSAAQDIRIRSVREADAFAVIHRQWRKLGFPFESLVPSYATAVGASADRPAALAELVGILANDGVRMPVRRIGSLHFGAGTPFETRLVPTAATAQRVLRPEVAATARGALLGVVQHGTAHRLGSTLQLADGTKLEIGGKTGTGDNRFQVFAPGGQLVSSRTVSRAGTFAFMIGQRYFGTITAYVMGEEAERYRFTSALPVQLLKALKPVLAQHLSNACVPAPGQTYLTRKSTVRTPQKVAAATASPETVR